MGRTYKKFFQFIATHSRPFGTLQPSNTMPPYHLKLVCRRSKSKSRSRLSCRVKSTVSNKYLSKRPLSRAKAVRQMQAVYANSRRSRSK
jgi:hypothetical protein